MTKIKICGNRELADLLAAAEAGADFVSLIFVPGVRRRVEVSHAAGVVSQFRERLGRTGPPLVGVFADQPLEGVQEVVQAVGLDYVQLSGSEPPGYWDAVGWPLIKAVHIRADLPVAEAAALARATLDQLRQRGILPLLDRHDPRQPGGLGEAFDWEVAQELARGFDLLLAGGLSLENVAQAVAQVRPWGVDVSSGVETRGLKDHEKVREFIARVRQADEALRVARRKP